MNEQMNKEDLVSNIVIKLMQLIPIKHSTSNTYLLHTCVQCCSNTVPGTGSPVMTKQTRIPGIMGLAF